MVTWRDYLVEDYRRRERLEYAARELQYRLVGERSAPPAGRFQTVVIRVGTWLEALGRRMQAAYIPEPSPEAPLKPLTGKVIKSC